MIIWTGEYALQQVNDRFEELERMTNPIQIASYLQQRGITAVRGCPHRCALAEAFADIHGISDLTVGAWTIQFFQSSPERRYCLRLTVAMRDFIQGFDDGEYPNLVADEKWCPCCNL